MKRRRRKVTSSFRAEEEAEKEQVQVPEIAGLSPCQRKFLE